MKTDMYEYENELYHKGVKCICGVDEVGRGPLIGPVVACAVVLGKGFVLEGLTDSKKLSEKKRELYNTYILENAVDVSIALVDAKTIDEINIYQASKKAMIKAINGLKCNVEHALIDAMPIPELEIESTSIIKGDSKSISIAAASVVAKVYRDNLMKEYAMKYPQYGFENHKGYPTKKHLEALDEYGVLPEHRRSYSPVENRLKRQLSLF